MKDISWFEKWILLKVIKKVVRQGSKKDLCKFYKLVHDQAEKEFSEDTIETMDQYLRYCFEKSCGLEVYQEKKRKK